MRAVFIFAPVLSALAIGALAQVPTPIEIPWDATVVEETFTPGTVSREVEPIEFRFNVRPGLRFGNLAHSRLTHSIRWMSRLVEEQMMRTELDQAYEVIETFGDGLMRLRATRRVISSAHKEGRTWVEEEVPDDDDERFLIIDEFGRILEVTGDEEEDDSTRAADLLATLVYNPLPLQPAQPGDSWTTTARFEGLEGMEAHSTTRFAGIEQVEGQTIAVLEAERRLDMTVPLDGGQGERDGSLSYVFEEIQATSIVTHRFNLDTGRFMGMTRDVEHRRTGATVSHESGTPMVHGTFEMERVGSEQVENWYED